MGGYGKVRILFTHFEFAFRLPNHMSVCPEGRYLSQEGKLICIQVYDCLRIVNGQLMGL